MIFSIYNDHVIVFDNSDLKTPYTQVFKRPSDWFRNPVGFYLLIAITSKERTLYPYPANGLNFDHAWDIDVSKFDSPPFAVCATRGGMFRAMFKDGKKTYTTPISDVKYGQNVLVSADCSTVFIDIDEVLVDGKINDIEEYVRRLNRISQASTQGTYYPKARYCTLEDFKLCLEESDDCKFDQIDERWKEVNFMAVTEVVTLPMNTLPLFTYSNLAGFKNKEQISEDPNV